MIPSISFSINQKQLAQIRKDAAAFGKIGLKRGGVVTEGEASAYALVWEWGNARQTQKGPKTTLGVNPDGQRVWLTIQAPFGYIRINSPRYAEIVVEELSKIDLRGLNPQDVKDALVDAIEVVSEKVAEVIKDTAPVDTGELRASIKVVDSDDRILVQAQKSDYGHEALNEEDFGELDDIIGEI